MYKSNDIILNFKRQHICMFADVLKSEVLSWIRLATLDEIELYKEFDKKIVKFTEITHAAYPIRIRFNLKQNEGRRDRFKNKFNAIIHVKINQYTLWKLHKILNANNFQNYGEVVDYLLSLQTEHTEEVFEQLERANEKIIKLETQLKKIKELLR